MLHRTYILRSPAEGFDLVSSTNRALQAVAKALDQQYGYQGERDNGRGVVVHTWSELMDQSVLVRVAVDDVMPARYVVISAPEDKAIWAVAEELGKVVPLEDRDGLIRAAQNAESEPATLQRLGMGLNGTYDETAKELFVRGLCSQNADVRYNAAMAAAFARWDDLIQPLTVAAETESDAGVSRVMEYALQKCMA